MTQADWVIFIIIQTINTFVLGYGLGNPKAQENVLDNVVMYFAISGLALLILMTDFAEFVLS